MKIPSYSSFKSKTELWRFQIYHPSLTITKTELFVGIPTNCRVVIGNGYFGFGFSILGFGFGFDYSLMARKDAKNRSASQASKINLISVKEEG